MRGSVQVDPHMFGGSGAPQRIDPHSKIEDLRMKVEDRRSKTVPEDLTRPAANKLARRIEVIRPCG